MKIRNQEWQIDDKVISLKLREPWWSAWQKFGWEEHCEGFGISLEIYRFAKGMGKKILLDVKKYGKYLLNPKKAVAYEDCLFTARDNKKLIIIPKFICSKVK